MRRIIISLILVLIAGAAYLVGGIAHPTATPVKPTTPDEPHSTACPSTATTATVASARRLRRGDPCPITPVWVIDHLAEPGDTREKPVPTTYTMYCAPADTYGPGRKPGLADLVAITVPIAEFLQMLPGDVCPISHPETLRGEGT